MRLAPSILSANAAHLSREVRDVERAGIDLIHFDVMDGHFVPNITFGANVVAALKKETAMDIDVHLMVDEPDHLIPSFINAGADMISVHAEACRHLHRTIQLIKDGGVQAGVVLNPATPFSQIKPVLPDLDYILIMTVDPGFGGQTFIDSMLQKIHEAKLFIDAEQLNINIEVDGGINKQTLPLCLKAGASIIVAGSAVFGQKNRLEAIHTLTGIIA
ncbi:ribulose-phosphate 3-epimerase [Sporolactobacillus sp. THM19-2]|uniref:ribulose-phosphate 3-epimerase n=1 Tax=Sporolactobacillus sp. THM19-2 TaxID=2511171 RepID=UPI00101F5A99|nr:ribulose-phosphate 3-epimerase [Sporolactobacillus sp. THM19-2]RYL87801.1 ribulose-phosphate 3-epimerase [Sporolactobacillus sp. THM19-2]